MNLFEEIEDIEVREDPEKDKKSALRDPKLDEADILMKAARMHLDRVKVLSNRNWNADVLFWGILLLSGSALIGYAVKADSLLSSVVSNQSWLIISGYYLSVSVYFFLMDGNKHRSLVTERNRYQLCQDKAFRLLGIDEFQMITPIEGQTTEDRAPMLIAPKWIEVSFSSIKRKRIVTSSVWGAKLISTIVMVSGVFAVSQIVAEYANARRQYTENQTAQIATLMPSSENERFFSSKRMAAISATPFPAEAHSWKCAFIDCATQTANLKIGTFIWIFGGLFLAMWGCIAFFYGFT